MFVSGSIVEALKKARDIGALIIIFVKGPDECSNRYEEMLKEAFHGVMEPAYVALKITDKTNIHYLEQIYYKIPIPSVLFIGKGGPLVGLISSNINKEYFNKVTQQALVDFAASGLDRKDRKLAHSAAKASTSKTLTADENTEASCTSGKKGTKGSAVGKSSITQPEPSSSSKCIPSATQKVHIGIRLPSNKMCLAEFCVNDTLGTLRSYIEGVCGVKKFVMATCYPRKCYTQADSHLRLTDTFHHKEMVVVELIEDADWFSVRATVSYIWSSVWFCATNWLGVEWATSWLGVEWATNWLAGLRAQIFGEPREVSASGAGAGAAQLADTSRSSPSPVRSSNIHRLRLSTDDLSDDDNTDNGNSTQQK